MYFMMVILSLNISHWWWLWSTLECLNWFLSLSLLKNILKLNFILWQSMSSLLLMIFLLMNMKNLLIVTLMMKMALPPFHMFFWMSSLSWSWCSFLIFLHSHKYTPTLFLSSILSKTFWWLMLTLPALSLVFMSLNLNFKKMYFTLSLMDSSWMLFSNYLSMKIFVIYLLMNFSVLMMMMGNMKSLSVEDLNTSFILNIILLMFLGAPPLALFFLKILIMGQFILFMNMLMGVLMLLYLYLIWVWIFISSGFKMLKYNNFKKTYFFMMINTLWLMSL